MGGWGWDDLIHKHRHWHRHRRRVRHIRADTGTCRRQVPTPAQTESGTSAGSAGQSGACPACPRNCAGQSGARPVNLAAAEGHNPFIVQGRLSACECHKLRWRGDWLDAWSRGTTLTTPTCVAATFCAGCAGAGADAAGAPASAPVGSAASGQVPERQTSGGFVRGRMQHLSFMHAPCCWDSPCEWTSTQVQLAAFETMRMFGCVPVLLILPGEPL